MKRQRNEVDGDAGEPLVFEAQRISNSPRLLSRLAKRVSAYLDDR